MLENHTIPKLIKIIGREFPTVYSKKKRTFGIYLCGCGKEFKAQPTNIKSGNTKSCGCLKIEKAGNLNRTHGLTSHRLYSVLKNMVNRCNNKNVKRYCDYGGRGITVCEEWREDFKKFYDWAMASGYRDDLTIDRIDNNGNYEPNNCRWSTRETQARNTRKIIKANKTGYRGVNHKGNKYAASIGLCNKKIYLGSFKTAIEAAQAYDAYVINNNLEHTKNFS